MKSDSHVLLPESTGIYPLHLQSTVEEMNLITQDLIIRIK